MALSSQLISQFAKMASANNSNKTSNSDSSLYGKVVEYNGKQYVKLDGSDLLTPVDTTASIKENDRVTVSIQNHTATVTGNLSDPAASGQKLDDTANQISEFEIIIAHKVSAEELTATNAYLENLKGISAKFEELDVVTADIENLQALIANIGHLTATDIEAVNAKLENIRAEFGSFTNISTTDLDAVNAEIDNLKAYVGDFTYVSTDVLEAIRANIKTLDVEKLSAKDAELTYANVDFANIDMAAVEKLFADSGIIEDLVVSDGHITGELVGVTIKGDLIEAGTLKADKLVVKGSDGIYYKLNVESLDKQTLEKVSEEELQNGLHGDTIIAKTITAEKIHVDDLVAFGATIGGFNITESSLYSGVKSTVGNTTRGVYLDRDGQVAFGDASNFLKYYKDANGNYKLEVSADAIKLGANKKPIVEYIESSIEIGGRNLLRNADFANESERWGGANSATVSIDEVDGLKCLKIDISTATSPSNGYGVQSTIMLEHSQNHIFSAKVYVENDMSISASVWYDNSGWKSVTYKTISCTAGWNDISFTFVSNDSYSHHIVGLKPTVDYADALIYLYHPKLEKGTIATDFTIAPEDVDSLIDNAHSAATGAQSTASNVQSRVAAAELVIDSISNCISMMVTDENGTSMMTQTADGGWTFSMASVQKAVSDVSTSLGDLTKDVGSTEAAVDALQQAVADLGETAEYVRIATVSRNLLLNSDFSNGTSNWYNAGLTTFSVEDDSTFGKVMRFSASSTGSSGYRLYQGSNSVWGGHTEDLEYTLTFWAKASIDTTITTNVGGNTNSTTHSVTTTWQKYTKTYVAASTGSLTFWANTANVTIYLANVQLEYGDYANEYTSNNTEPCVELGEGDSQFKLQITNTRVMFSEGSTVLTYIDTDGLVTDNITVKREIRQGSWSWAVRNNGNLGLVWKGV